MVSPISISIQARPQARIEVSPLSILLVVGKIDLVPTTHVSLGATAGEVTEITDANVATMLGAVATTSPATQTPLGRAAYDLIEATSSVHVYVLPFAVDSSDSPAERATKVASALTGALGDPVQLAKFPDSGLDLIVLPRECAVSATAPTVIAALKTVCAALESVALVDAGDSGAAADARPASTAPSVADLRTWAGANGGVEVYALSNRGDVANYNGMWGSVIMAAHHARWASREGVGSSPYDLTHPLAGAANLTPARVLSLTDGSSDAVALDRDYELGSLVVHGGNSYIWGGQSNPGAAVDAREQLSNHLVANRSLKIARDIAARVIRRRATGDRIQALRLDIETAIADAYVPDSMRDVEVDTPTLAGRVLTVPYSLRFYEYIQAVSMTAEVYV